MVKLDFSVELDYEVIQPTEFEFILHASRTSQQTVLRDHFAVWPDIPTNLETCSFLGNQHVRLHAEPGPLKIQYSALVEIRHYLSHPSQMEEVSLARLPLDILHYLHPSRYCPSDRLYSLAAQQFGNLPKGYARVQAICDWVRNRTRFQPGTTNSYNCAMDTLNSQVGVCRDFAHLMISLCRALNIPARYVTSIDYGANPALGPMDFHAYVEVYLSGRWYIFDPTGISMSTGLVRLATGRDANDVAFATMFGSAAWSMPRVSMVAVENPADDIIAPAPTDLAISTSDFPQMPMLDAAPAGYPFVPIHHTEHEWRSANR